MHDTIFEALEISIASTLNSLITSKQSDSTKISKICSGDMLSSPKQVVIASRSLMARDKLKTNYASTSQIVTKYPP